MNKDPTYVHLPDTLSFPIEIVSIDAPVSSSVSRGSRLLSYKFGTIDSATKTIKPLFGSWDSILEGEIQAWNFKAGDFISARKARERPILVLLEPCKHEIQYGGMCANCGKNMMMCVLKCSFTCSFSLPCLGSEDYLGASDASRASIQMNHSSMGPTVSLEVAKKLSKNDAERLQKAKKLSLIVDLDQTIVHATVDPTVGEWISEGEAWETRQSSKSSKKDTNSTTPEPEDNASDECNPNWDALKDVKKFKLAPDIAGQKGAQKHPDHANTMYYIKPRCVYIFL
jgi:RNA polymerase II subunit A-like phosphatase